MGLLFIDKTADYSALALGHAGLYTSVTAGLLALSETRRNASKATHNSAPGGGAFALIGNPVFTAGEAEVRFGTGVDFKTKPAGSHTFAVVAGVKMGGVLSDMVVGSYSAQALATGAAYLTIYNRRVTLSALCYPAGSVPPLADAQGREVYQDFAVDRPEMFFGVLESGVSLRLYHPRTGVLSVLSAAGRDFSNDNPPSYRNFPFNASTNSLSSSLFAHWSGVLTPAQMNTFYAEMQPQLARVGVAI